MRRIRLERQITKFIDDQQLGLGIVCQALVQPAIGMRLGKLGHQCRRRREQHGVACHDRLPGDGTGQKGLPRAGRTRGIPPNITTPMGGSFIGITLATVSAWRS